MAGLYVHIPFCKSRCIYCGFYSTTGKEALQDRYIEALGKEMELRKDYLGGEKIKTVYVGGGTPSSLTYHNLLRLGEYIGSATADSEVEEYTIECNPNDISDDLCLTMKVLGVDRVSMGVQTFSNERLLFLRRRHKAEDIRPAIETLRRHGISNISIDLMFGFPQESLAEWNNDIDEALKLGVEHISAYSLMYEEGTALHKMLREGKIRENGEDVSAEMYELLIDKLEENGYEHYEISNFCKPRKQSKHNSSYWNGAKYLGVGAAAHSYDLISRQWNVSNIEEYIHGIEEGVPQTEREVIDEDTRYNDLITTALRTKKGLDLVSLSQRHYEYITEYAGKGIAAGLLEISDNHLRLTRKGLFVSDSVMAELIYA